MRVVWRMILSLSSARVPYPGQDRLKALKETDTEAYYNLLKEHKNEKLLNVLTETDKYLKALGLAVRPYGLLAVFHSLPFASLPNVCT